MAIRRGLGRVKPVANLARCEDEDFWVEKANELSKNALEVYVKEHRNQKPEDPLQVKSFPRTREAQVSLPEEFVQRLEQLKKHEFFVDEQVNLIRHNSVR